MNVMSNTCVHVVSYTCSTFLELIQCTSRQIVGGFNQCLDKCFRRTKDLFHNQVEQKIIYVSVGSIVHPFPWKPTYEEFIHDLCTIFPQLSPDKIDYLIVRDNNFEQIKVGSQIAYEALVPLIDLNNEKNIYTSHVFMSYAVFHKSFNKMYR